MKPAYLIVGAVLGFAVVSWSIRRAVAGNAGTLPRNDAAGPRLPRLPKLPDLKLPAISGAVPNMPDMPDMPSMPSIDVIRAGVAW